MQQQITIQPKDGSVKQFAADYPEVMVVIVSVLFGLVMWFIKRKR